ncbi:MAG: hypothetical protein HY965_03150, partial [Ignavibacteriales bacterium]|nr:hypothetical protein [Ignavibacteriales bacterium]
MRGLLVTILSLLLCQAAYTQWVNVSGPGNGSVNVLLFDGTNLYAGVESHGVHKSTDFGVTWRGLYKGFGNTANNWGTQSIRSLLITPNKMFAGTYANGMYFSTDKGENWVKQTGIANGTTIRTMFLKGSDIYAGTAGVLKSTNNGSTWVNPSPTFSTAVNQFAVAGGVLFAATDGKGIRASTDDGVTWTGRNSGITGDTNNFYFSAIIAKGNTLFATGSTGNSSSPKVFKSTDLGLNWSNAGGTLSSSGTELYLHQGNDIYLGTNNQGTYRTTDDGQAWAKVDSLKGNPYIISFTSYGDTILAGGNSGLFAGNGGVYRSVDHGANWKNTVSPMAYSFINVLTGKDNYMYTGTSAGNNQWAGGMYVSSNYGLTWEKSDQGYIWYNVSAILPLGNIVLAGVSTNVAQGVSRSTDYGKTWSYSNTGLPQYAIINRLILKGTNIFAAVGDGGFNNHYGGIYLSTDNGLSWTKKNTGFPNEPDVKTVAALGTALYAGLNTDKLYKSTDEGSTWSPLTPSGFPAGVYFDNLLVYKDKIFVPTLYNGLFVTSDGITFSASGTGIGTGSDFGVRSVTGDDTVLFASTQSKGVFRSSNGGLNWFAFSEGFPGSSITAGTMYLNGPVLYCAGVLNAVWARNLSGTTSAGKPHGTSPEGFSIEQNYPNPFNPATTIRFTLSTA